VQALKIIPLLADQFPIERAKMLIRVVVAPDHAEAVKPQLLALMAKVMNEIQKGPYVLVQTRCHLPFFSQRWN
jgi:hypothetical protein